MNFQRSSFGPFTPEEIQAIMNGPYGELKRAAAARGILLTAYGRKLWSVKIEVSGSITVYVEASDEESATELAMAEAGDLSVRGIDSCYLEVTSIEEVSV